MSKLQKALGQPIENLKGLGKNTVAIKLIVLGSLFAALFVIFMFGSVPHKYNLKAGDIALEDIYAPSNMVDRAATEQRKLDAEENVQPVYEFDLTVQIELVEKIDLFFKNLYTIRETEEMDIAQKTEAMEQITNIGIDRKSILTLLRADDNDLAKLKLNINYIINQVLDQKITEDQLEAKRQIIRDFFSDKIEESSLNEIGSNISIMLIKPNMFYNSEATEANRAEALENVEDVIIKRGTLIISKGQEVKQHQLKLLEAYGLLDNGNNIHDLSIYSGYTIISVVCIFIICLYLGMYDKKIWNNHGSLFLLCMIMVLGVAFSVATRLISVYLIILPAFAMIASIMLNPKAAILANIVMTVLIGYITAMDVPVMSIMLLTGILGAVMVHNTNHRSTIVYAGLGVSILSALLITSFGLHNHAEIKSIIAEVLYGLGGGVLSAILTIGTLPFLETIFDIITPIKLLELSNPNQPLMRRLLIEAPGTYYHSILVGNLSESAAEEVDANSLLCRVASYYHDIGKIKRPYFFKENQITKDNPHDKITPNLSALIITSHVRDGVDIAKKHKLPSSVINIIRQHHGNTLTAYFYHKALNTEGGEQITEDKFRYPFPKPQSKEAAIVMLADSVEAYIRSLTEPTQDQVEQGVKKIINDKLQDGQLENCELTLKDLDKIAKAFVKVLAGIFHDRIEYPDMTTGDNQL
ncbi:MAG: HD family phosphohydrolase [Bacillota bacterium]